MSNAIWIATVFGPLLFILGLWMLILTPNLIKILVSVKNSLAAFWLMGFINLLLGLFIVSLYNKWVLNGTILVTFLGWALIIRGLLILFIPKLLLISKVKNYRFIKSVGFIPLVWGLGLCWIAFFY